MWYITLSVYVYSIQYVRIMYVCIRLRHASDYIEYQRYIQSFYSVDSNLKVPSLNPVWSP